MIETGKESDRAERLIASIIELQQRQHELLLQLSAALPRGKTARRTSAFDPTRLARFQLTPREMEILGLIVAGNTGRRIGESLGISGRTVETHRNKIRRKLGVKRVGELVATVWGLMT